MKLQDFRFNKSQYERPTQKKICGWSIYGKPCQIGPNEKGECRAEYECVPYKRNDRWHCTRPSSSGGKCKSGPSCTGTCSNRIPKCVPLNSTRNKRGKVVVWTSMLSVALVLIFLFGPYQHVFLNPGDLSSQHSFDNQTCTDCHTIEDTSPSTLVKSAFATLSVKNESNKCLSCHKLGRNALNPHNTGLNELEETTSRIRQRLGGDAQGGVGLFTPAGFSVEQGEGAVMACVSCHTEHKGRNFDIKQLSNTQCATCHVNRFSDFAGDHPQFVSYPYKQRSGLIFDHAAHIGDYFQKEKYLKRAPQGCNNCHEVSLTGKYMGTISFDRSCADCHGKEVTGEKLEVRGIPVFNLPGIDVQSLKENGFRIGQWPSGLEDQEISSFMLYLLSSDTQVRPLLTRILNGEVDLTDLSDANRTTMRQVTAFIWGIKQVLYDIGSEGHDAVEIRLESLSRNKLPVSQVKALIALMPVDTLLNASKSWLPGLKKEVQAFRAGRQSATRLIATRNTPGLSDKAKDDWSRAGGWYQQDYTVYYRPGGHKDSFLKNWIDFTRAASDDNAIPEQANLFTQLSHNKRPGQCGKCHSVEEQGGQVKVNWKPGRFDEKQQNFSKFDHSAHFSMLEEKGCKACHKLDKEAKYIDSYKHRQAANFSSNFSSIEKEVCQACHNSSNVGDSCLTCHNYHIGRIEPALPVSKL